MTREIVIGILKSHLEHDTLDAATYHALGCAITELECICKPQNRPNDKRSTDKGMFIPESPKDAEMDCFRANVDKSLNELNKRIMQRETEIEMLWNEVRNLKGGRK